MVVSSTEVQNNFGKYVEMAAGQEIIITKNGSPIARLLGMKETVSFLSDRLVGLVPCDIDESEAKMERLKRQ
jgi:prevent-host-death family protein